MPTNLNVQGAITFTKERPLPPASPTRDRAIMWIEDDGAGKTKLMVKFATGAAQQVAIEP